jgi:tripartite-type tricarboxylate transporter receptor subunit TctC
MTIITRRGLLAAGASVLATPALAQYPDRSIRIISGFPPGGLNDIVSRAVAQALAPILGQAVVVENRAGAGGSVGATAAARAAPDGYTLWMGIVDTQAINPFAYRQLQYDPIKDFAPITLVARFPFALVVGPSRPAVKSFPEIVTLAKSKPEEISFASWGVASTPHLGMMRVSQALDLKMLHVPFTGQAPAMQAIIAGQVDIFPLPAGGAESMTRDGKTRAVAVFAPGEIPLFPGVPPIKQFGVPIETGLWKALYAPAGTPRPVIDRLNAAMREALKAPGVVEVLRQQGAVAEPTTPEELLALNQRELVAWGEVVKSTNATLD